jgi:hypothetical protein
MSTEIVMLNPVYIRNNEATMPAKGPAIAKSNIEFQFFGGDLKGVMAPNRPVDTDGMKFGKPMSN